MLQFRFPLLSMLCAVLMFDFIQCKKVICTDYCCSFVEAFPVKLKALRNSYDKIRDYYESKDDLETSLFNRTILEHFKSPYGCSVMNDILYFYLKTVLPSAIQGERKRTKHKTPIDTIGDVFHQLKRELLKCRNYFTCKKPFEISHIQDSYSQMGEKGLYKAMGELDLLFNYIEDYLVSKRHKN